MRLALVSLAALILAACAASGASQEAGEAASVSASPAVSEWASASPAVSGWGSPVLTPPSSDVRSIPQAPQLARDSVAAVVTTDLVLRSAPGTGTDSEIFPGRLDDPAILFVVDGPVEASGYEWYLVRPFAAPGDPQPGSQSLGWVAAAGRDGEPWIAPATLDCPDTPDVASLIELGFGGLACYGDRSLTFVARYDGPDAIVPNTVSPAWLAGVGYHLRPIGCVFECPQPTPTPVYQQSLFVHRPDGSVFPNGFGHPVGTHVQVVGHFDDPAALECVAGPLPGDARPPHAEETILLCRAQFVVTEAVAVIH